MNPLTNIRNLAKLSESEIKLGTVGSKASWHNQYKDSAWIFFGGISYELTEGDVICVFSQYGEIVNVNLIRDKTSGKSKGFGFICYENQKSTDLAVDNFNGTKILGRVIRVDHVGNYKPPKDTDEADELSKFLREEGCSTKIIEEIEEKKHTNEQKRRPKQKYESKHEWGSSRNPEKRYNDNQYTYNNQKRYKDESFK